MIYRRMHERVNHMDAFSHGKLEATRKDENLQNNQH